MKLIENMVEYTYEQQHYRSKKFSTVRQMLTFERECNKQKL